MATSLSYKVKAATDQLAQRLGYDIRKRTSLRRAAGDMDFLLTQLKQSGLAPRWILDVGANNGQWSAIAKQVFPSANCCLIEPQIEMQADLDRFCQTYPGSQWILAGAGAEPGELLLTLWEDHAGSSFLPPQQADLQQTGKQRSVEIVTIDALLAAGKLSMPDIVKLDIQGFELEALKGGSQLFGQVAAIILEVSLFEFLPGQPLIGEVIQFMGDRNYVVYDFPGFARRPYDRALGQCDICFVPKDSPLRAANLWD
jgi:FkbM family methyltransferase